MYCDALTLAAVTDELRHGLLGGRVQRALLLEPLAIGLEVYSQHQRHQLLVSAHPGDGGRVHLVPHRLRPGAATPSPFYLRLRKHALGARLVDVQQPSFERIIRLTLESRHGLVVLVAEIMGRYSNIVLVADDGTILECAKRVPAHLNRYRVLLPGYLYVPPPKQRKLDLAVASAASLAEALSAQAELPLWERLVASVRAVSPLLAREVVHRVCGDVQCRAADAPALLAQLQELWGLAQSGNWQPSVALHRGQPVAYAPYLLTHCAEHQPVATISEAMTAYYALQSDGGDPYTAVRSRVQEAIASQRARQTRKKEALLSATATEEEMHELRRKGELLLAYGHQVRPGQTELVLPWAEGEQPVRIALDPTQTPVENAREYFFRYEKLKAAATGVPALLEAVDGELAYLDQLSTDLVLAQDQPGIASVERALAEAGYLSSQRKVKPPQTGPARLVSDDGLVILVGRNSWQNERVTFHDSTSDDMWLHAQGVPGGHVIIRTEGKEVPQATLRRAAELAAYYSASRSEHRVAVDYTLRKYVRRIRGGRPGQVTYQAQSTLQVQPRA